MTNENKMKKLVAFILFFKVKNNLCYIKIF